MTQFDNQPDRADEAPDATDRAGVADDADLMEVDAIGTPAVPPRPARPWWQGAWAGLAAGGLAVAVGMLIAAITDVVSPIDAVGSDVIDRTPRAVKEWAIRNFETNDKLVLRIGIFTVLALAEAVSAVLKPDPDDSPTLDWRPLVAILGAVGGFAVAISLFGLVPAFFVVILFSTLSERGYGWLPATVLSLVTCFAAWLLFSRLLGITLPLFRWGL